MLTCSLRQAATLALHARVVWLSKPRISGTQLRDEKEKTKQNQSKRDNLSARRPPPLLRFQAATAEQLTCTDGKHGCAARAPTAAGPARRRLSPPRPSTGPAPAQLAPATFRRCRGTARGPARKPPPPPPTLRCHQRGRRSRGTGVAVARAAEGGVVLRRPRGRPGGPASGTWYASCYDHLLVHPMSASRWISLHKWRAQ